MNFASIPMGIDILKVPGVVFTTLVNEYDSISLMNSSEVLNCPVFVVKVPVISETKT